MFGVIALSLLTLSSAQAGPLERVDKLIERGQTAQAIEVAQGLLAKNPGVKEYREAVVRAFFEHAASYNSIPAWKDFRKRFPDGQWHDEAYKREASVAWAAVAGSKERGDIQKYREAYNDGPLEAEAVRIEANLAYRDAQIANDVGIWQEFIASFPEDPRAKEASKKMEIAALKAARADGTPEALQKFLADFPESLRKGEVLRDLLMRGAKVDIPCPGTPHPQCAVLSPGTVITASWNVVDGYPVKPELVGWSESKGTFPVEEVLNQWAGQGWEIEVADLAVAMAGEQADNVWRLELDFPLKRPGANQIDGYAVKLQAEEAAPAIFPFKVLDTWPAPGGAEQRNVYRNAHSLTVEIPGGGMESLATVDDIALNDPMKGVRLGDKFVAWGSNGLVSIGLEDGGVERWVNGREVHNGWRAGENFFYEMWTGDDAELKRVDGTGSHTTLMPTPGRPDAPRQFRTLAVAEKSPVALFFIKQRGFGWVPPESEARPLAVPESVPKDPSKVVVAVDPGGKQAAFFVSDVKRPRIVMVTLATGKSAEFAVDGNSLFGQQDLNWVQAAWSDATGLVAQARGKRAPLGVIKLVEGGKIVLSDDEQLRIARGVDPTPPDAPAGSLAFQYKQSLTSFLR